MRDRLFAAREAVRLVWSVWRLSRKTGMPFDALMEAHIKVLDLQAKALDDAIKEVMVPRAREARQTEYWEQ